MKGKKVSVNLTPENQKKLEAISASTTRTMTSLINQAIVGIPILDLGNQKQLAIALFQLITLINKDEYADYQKEVESLCQLLNSLIQRVDQITVSKER